MYHNWSCHYSTSNCPLWFIMTHPAWHVDWVQTECGEWAGRGEITEINLNSFWKQSHSMTYSLTSSTAHLIMFFLHYSFFWKMKAGWRSHLLTDAGRRFEISTKIKKGRGGVVWKASTFWLTVSWSWQGRLNTLPFQVTFN